MALAEICSQAPGELRRPFTGAAVERHREGRAEERFPVAVHRERDVRSEVPSPPSFSQKRGRQADGRDRKLLHPLKQRPCGDYLEH